MTIWIVNQHGNAIAVFSNENKAYAEVCHNIISWTNEKEQSSSQAWDEFVNLYDKKQFKEAFELVESTSLNGSSIHLPALMTIKSLELDVSQFVDDDNAEDT